MVREAATFLLSRLFSLASSPDWLAPPSRQHMLDSHIIPYLTSLNYHLSSTFFPPLLTPPLVLGQPGTSLSAAAASACTVISFIEELFPHTLGSGPDGGMHKRFPRCEALRVEVESRPRIKEWIEAGKRATTWTLWPAGSTEAIKEAADKYDKEEGEQEQQARLAKELSSAEGVAHSAEMDTGM